MRQGGGARPRVEMAGDAGEGCLLSLSVIGQFVFSDVLYGTGGWLHSTIQLTIYNITQD